MDHYSNDGVDHFSVVVDSVDGLTGFPEAIAAIFPETEVQLVLFIRYEIQ